MCCKGGAPFSLKVIAGLRRAQHRECASGGVHVGYAERFDPFDLQNVRRHAHAKSGLCLSLK